MPEPRLFQVFYLVPTREVCEGEIVAVNNRLYPVETASNEIRDDGTMWTYLHLGDSARYHGPGNTKVRVLFGLTTRGS